MERPQTRYARSGDLSIAYQVVGDGPVHLVVAPGFVSHVEYQWEEPSLARYLRRLASFSRLIVFDKRGTGMSDRTAGIATLEERMDDLRAVMDDAGAERAVLYGASEGVPMSALFAATYPERTAAVVLYGGFASSRRQPDYPWRPTADELRQRIEDRARTIHRPSVSARGSPRRWDGSRRAGSATRASGAGSLHRCACLPAPERRSRSAA